MKNSARISNLRRIFAVCAIMTVFGFTMISAGAIKIPSSSATASQTYFVDASSSCVSSGTQVGNLQYATVPTSSGSSAFSGRNSCYYLSSSSIPASFTSDDITLVLYMYSLVGTSQDVGLAVCEVGVNTCALDTSTTVSVSGTSCAAPTQVTLDFGITPFSFSSGDTLELIVSDASSSGSSFVLCSGGSTSSYLTLNPSESTTVTTTVTSVSTSVSTSTVTSDFTTTATSVSTETDTVTQTDTITQTLTSSTTLTETQTVTDTNTVTETDTTTTTVTSVSTVTQTTTQTVTASAVFVKCIPSSPKVGQSVNCIATAIAGSPPAGTITFSTSGGGSFTSSVKCSTSGNTETCSVSYKPSSRGTQTITATYSGDPNYLSSSASTTLKVGAHSNGLMLSSVAWMSGLFSSVSLTGLAALAPMFALLGFGATATLHRWRSGKLLRG